MISKSVKYRDLLFLALGQLKYAQALLEEHSGNASDQIQHVIDEISEVLRLKEKAS